MRHPERQDCDVNALLERFEGDLSLLDEIVRLFIRDVPHQLDRIAEAVRTDDAHRLEHAAHTLRGSLLNLCAAAAAERAARLEQMGVTGQLSGAEEDCAALGAEVALIVDLLHRAVLRESPAPA